MKSLFVYLYFALALAATSQAAWCPSLSSGIWGGAGTYCLENNLYYCGSPGAWGSLTQSCPNGCQQAPPGNPDTCSSAPPPPGSVGTGAGDCSAHDVDILAKTCVGEYGSGTYNDKLAILMSIRNRKNDYRWPGTYAEVAQQPWQYSCWNADYRYRIENLTPEDSSYANCLQPVRDMCNGANDITLGANHYYADYIAAPSWADWSKYTIKIGAHYFFKL